MAEILEIVLKIILALLALVGGKEIIDRVVVKFNKKETNHTVTAASGEAVGRDKVVINNYNFPGIGNPEDLFSSPRSRETESLNDPYTEGLYLINLNKDEVSALGVFINGFYEKIDKGVTRNALTMLQGAVFAIGTKDLGNPEWKEQCATSLREIFHAWKSGLSGFSSDFCRFYKPKDTELTQEESDTIRDFWDRYQYFTGIDHHEAETIMGSLRKIKGDQTLKLEDCFKDDIFIEEVKNYFTLFSKIVSFTNHT